MFKGVHDRRLRGRSFKYYSKWRPAGKSHQSPITNLSRTKYDVDMAHEWVSHLTHRRSQDWLKNQLQMVTPYNKDWELPYRWRVAIGPLVKSLCNFESRNKWNVWYRPLKLKLLIGPYNIYALGRLYLKHLLGSGGGRNQRRSCLYRWMHGINKSSRVLFCFITPMYRGVSTLVIPISVCHYQNYAVQ